MTKINDKVLYIEPRNKYDKAIIGITIDEAHLIYSIKKLKKLCKEDVYLSLLRQFEYITSEFKPIIINTL